MTTLLLVRHGRTRANARGILAGRADGNPLDGEGLRQARSVAARLRDVPLDAVVHSPLDRCRATAAAIVARQFGAVPVHADPAFLECDYGAWTGCRLRDLAADPLWEQVQAVPSSVAFPGGEGMADMAARAWDGAHHWAGRHPGGTVAIVSHGDVIKAILSAALGQPFDAFQRIAISPGSLSLVELPMAGRPMVLGMNHTGGRMRRDRPSTGPTVGGGSG